MANLQDERRRGQLAKQIIDNPLWAEAKATLLESLTDAWRSTHPSQSTEREEIWKMLQAASAAFDHVESVMTTGELADKQLEKLNG